MTNKAAIAVQSIDLSLIEKYTLRGPRYTSYPTAPMWRETVGEDQFWKHVDITNQPGNDSRPISVYIHVPFCAQRCYYCACNVIITNREDVCDKYVDTVSREASLVAPKLMPERKVIQFHLGGGTPTTLTPSSMARLFDNYFDLFNLDQNSEKSIEVDSRVTTSDHVKVLSEYGFNRISLGVEDFYEETQIAINRMQDAEETYQFVLECREHGFESVNIDLVYGLPHQTLNTFHQTLDTIFRISPDRIALYNYAHLPAKVPHQRKIDEDWLPDASLRVDIFKVAVERFIEEGYEYIGMDHFAKPMDELTLAQKEGTLQRNFMGFTTRAGADLYSFGTSAISNLPALYTQNVKKLKTYNDMVESGKLPIERGIELSRDDQIRRWVIGELMCNLGVSYSHFQQQWGEDFESYFSEELDQLQPFIRDGLIKPDLSNELRVTDIGQIIIRPVAMTFDWYLSQARKKKSTSPVFSNTL